MIFDGLFFHNVAAMPADSAYPGYRLQRLPNEIKAYVDSRAADLCRSVEIRFYVHENPLHVLDGAVYLMARDTDGEAVIFWGDYQTPDVIPLPCGVITPVHIAFPSALADLPAGRFPNRLCRIFLNNRSSVQYIGHEGLDVRPPRPKEQPQKKLVCIGSSITHGGVARSNCNCFAQLTAQRLGMDIINLGFSGSMKAAPELADYIAQCVQGDAFFVELGANMLDDFSIDAFESRARYMLKTIALSHPDAPVIATGIPYGVWNAVKREAFNKALEDCVSDLALPNLHFLISEKLMPDWSLLSADGIHPSDYGHIVMSEKLTEEIKKYL